jgi:hypothetical protein
MTPEFKARWIADLRKHPKTTGYLKHDGAYCCLGVACMTLGGHFEKGGDGNTRPFLGSNNLAYGEELAYSTLELMGLTYSAQTTLIDLNDRSDTFEPVIEWIEENL